MTEDRFGIVGKLIARTYEVEQVVAEGGFGVVYQAYHKGFRAKVALKCLKIPQELSEEQRRSFLEQFRSEAEVLFRLSTQISHIVRPLHVDAFQNDADQLVPFMALEWLEGSTLDDIITSRAEAGSNPLRLPEVYRLLTPVADALEQAHHLAGTGETMSVVHRDMKPENIFVTRTNGEPVAKILDFGISKVKTTASQLAGRASQSSSALVSFSPAYAAPEQWAPRRYGGTGIWTDVWGLAITVVEALKGEAVVDGDQAEMMGTIIDPDRRPTPQQEGIPVSDAVESVFTRALAVDPRVRYQTVGEFWASLGQALTGPVATGLRGAEPIQGAQAAQVQRSAAERGIQASRPLLPARAAAPSLAKRLSPAFALLLLSAAISLLSRAWLTTKGGILAFGPLKASWVAGALALYGIYRIVRLVLSERG
ncbi:MAG: serine/threonine protein kinase [Polyangiaceae bacterium]|nr:serine/threonine protein kinase [Polyangiaceae bacterium]